MANTQVPSELIATNAISGTIIADNAITSVHIAQNQVTAVQIPDGSITATQIAADAVGATELAASSVVTASIQDDQVTGDKLANNIQIAGTLGVTGVISPTTHIDMPDSAYIKMGTGDDLHIGHDGSNSYITEQGTGNLKIRTSALNVMNQNNDETIINALENGAVTLYYDNSAKLATASGGVSVTGDLTLADDNNYYAGSSNELAIYHTGSGNSIISHSTSASGAMYIDAGGTLNIRNSTGGGENMIVAVGDGAVTLYYDNAEKLATTSGGVSVTGNIANASGDMTIDVAGDIILDADGGDIKFKDGGTDIASLKNSGGTFIIKSEASDADIYFNGNDGGTAITAMAIDMSAGGQVGIGTTSPSDTLEIQSSGNDDGFRLKGSGGDNLVWLHQQATDSAIMRMYDGGTVKVLLDASGGNSYFNGGSVGIGTSSPSRLLDLETTNAGGSTLMSLVSATDGNCQILFGDTASDTQGKVLYNNDGNYMAFNTADSERMRILSGGGITFNGDTATANALDDYERGTWTPVYRGSTTAGTYTYGTQQGSYVKVGELVTVWCNLNGITDTTEGTGSVRIGGLPYNSVASDGVSWYPGSCVLEHFNVDAACVNLAAAADDATDRVAFWETKDNGGNDTVSITDRGSDAADIWFTCTYRTAP